MADKELRTLGASGLRVTPIGLGLAALGRPGYINLGHGQDLRQEYEVAAMESRAHAVLDAAWSAGIRYFDAARSYGQAEQFLASWLVSRSIAPEAVTVGSKWGYTYTAGWQVEAQKHEVKDHSLAVLRRQIGESRALLGDSLDLYQIHSVTPDSGVLEDMAVLGELAHLRDTGLKIGLSLSGPEQGEMLRRAMAVRFDGAPMFDTVQATWNLLEPWAGPALQAAREAGMGVIVKEALANGRLTSRNDDPAFGARRMLLEEMAAEGKTTIDALALAAVLAQGWAAQRWAAVVLSGAATVEQLRSNLAALAVSWTEEMAGRWRPMVEAPVSYWSIRSQLVWN